MDMSEGVTNIQKEIIKTIVTNGEIYHNELSRIIVDEKKLMVSRTYLKNMNVLTKLLKMIKFQKLVTKLLKLLGVKIMGQELSYLDL